MKIYTHDELPQGQEAWLKVRLGKFGGSDAQAVAAVGKGLETLCYEKVGEILTKRLKEGYVNQGMERGTKMESTARLAYEMETGNTVVQVGYIELSDRVGVSPDGLVGDDGMIEIKCPSDSVFVRFMVERKIDTKYEWQMSHQMYVADRKWVDFVVFNDNLNKIIITRYMRDEEKINKIKSGLDVGIKSIEEMLGKVS